MRFSGFVRNNTRSDFLHLPKSKIQGRLATENLYENRQLLALVVDFADNTVEGAERSLSNLNLLACQEGYRCLNIYILLLSSAEETVNLS